MTRLPMLGFLALTLAGCGGSDSGTNASVPGCSLKVGLSGDVTTTGDGSKLACAFTANPAGPTSISVVLALKDVSFTMTLDNMSEGATGDFPATIFIGQTSPSGQWTTTAGGCTVTLTKDTKKSADANGRVYQLVGSGKCTDAAQSLSGGGAVVISDFTFTAEIAWNP